MISQRLGVRDVGASAPTRAESSCQPGRVCWRPRALLGPSWCRGALVTAVPAHGDFSQARRRRPARPRCQASPVPFLPPGAAGLHAPPHSQSRVRLRVPHRRVSTCLWVPSSAHDFPPRRESKRMSVRAETHEMRGLSFRVMNGRASKYFKEKLMPAKKVAIRTRRHECLWGRVERARIHVCPRTGCA